MANISQGGKHTKTEKLKKELGERIAKIREASETKKQKDFTATIGISQSQVSAIEKGRSNLSIDVIASIVRLRINGARINMDWLFTGEGQMLIPLAIDDKNIDGVILNKLSHLGSRKKEVIIKVIESYDT